MKASFVIEGMGCAHCVMAVKKALSELNVKVHKVEIGEAVVDYDINTVSENDIKKAIQESGYLVKEIKQS